VNVKKVRVCSLAVRDGSSIRCSTPPPASRTTATAYTDRQNGRQPTQLRFAALLKTVAANKDAPLPLKLFEVGDVILVDDSGETGCRNERRLGAVHCATETKFEVIQGLLNRVMEVMGVPLEGAGLHITLDRFWCLEVTGVPLGGVQTQLFLRLEVPLSWPLLPCTQIPVQALCGECCNMGLFCKVIHQGWGLREKDEKYCQADLKERDLLQVPHFFVGTLQPL